MSFGNLLKRKTLSGHSEYVICCAISPDNRLFVSGSDDKTLILWDRDGNRIRTLRGHDDRVYCCTFSDDGKHVISGGGDRTLRVWNIETWQETAVLRGHTSSVWGCDTFGNEFAFVRINFEIFSFEMNCL